MTSLWGHVVVNISEFHITCIQRFAVFIKHLHAPMGNQSGRVIGNPILICSPAPSTPSQQSIISN